MQVWRKLFAGTGIAQCIHRREKVTESFTALRGASRPCQIGTELLDFYILIWLDWSETLLTSETYSADQRLLNFSARKQNMKWTVALSACCVVLLAANIALIHQNSQLKAQLSLPPPAWKLATGAQMPDLRGIDPGGQAR